MYCHIPRGGVTDKDVDSDWTLDLFYFTSSHNKLQ
jgi:hypothetical protein